MTPMDVSRLQAGDVVLMFSTPNVNTPHRGDIDLALDHFIRIRWRAKGAGYDVLNKTSPVWRVITKELKP